MTDSPATLATRILEAAKKADQDEWCPDKCANIFTKGSERPYDQVKDTAEYVALACPANLIRLIEAAQCMAETLDSIAEPKNKPADSVEYWEKEGASLRFAETMAKDTELARAALAKWRGVGK